MAIQFPKKMSLLFKPSRYKVLWGGRGSGKSYSIALALLLLGSRKTMRILCARETQKSLDVSVHALLSDLIRTTAGLSDFYEVQQRKIIGRNETEFLFSGLRDANSLKSFEAADICWVEEAEAVSEDSWDKIIPTIRKEYKDNESCELVVSEIWVSFNPELEDNNTYQRFVVNTPEDCLIEKVNYYDNPFFPEVLRREMEQLKRTNYNKYLHIWEGECKLTGKGEVFKMDWFKRYAGALPKNMGMIVHSWDTAYKVQQHNDPSAFTCWRIMNNNMYMEDMVNDRMDYPTLKERVIAYGNRDKPDAILIEDKASGQSLIQELLQQTRLNVIAITPTADKETRARIAAGSIQMGRVHLPEAAPWLGEFERQIQLFPNGKNDDIVDSTSQFINWYNKSMGGSDSYIQLMEELYGS